MVVLGDVSLVRVRFVKVWSVGAGTVSYCVLRRVLIRQGFVWQARNKYKGGIKLKFTRRTSYRIKTDPQIVGEYCYELEQKTGRKLTPKELVEAARDVNSPLHNEFEWNDTKAAQKYREQQARYIISSIELVIETVETEPVLLDLQITESEPYGVKFYHSLDSSKQGYENIFSISNDAEKRKRLLENCLKDIATFREKYNTLRKTLPKLFTVIDGTLEEMGS